MDNNILQELSQNTYHQVEMTSFSPSITLRVEWQGKSCICNPNKTWIELVELVFNKTEKIVARLPEKGVESNEKQQLLLKNYKDTVYRECLQIDLNQISTLSLRVGRFSESATQKHYVKRENEKVAFLVSENLTINKNYKIVIDSHDKMSGFEARLMEDN